MKKNIFFLLLISSAPLVQAQELLSLDEVFTNTKLYPQLQGGIQWIPNTNTYVFAGEDRVSLIRTDAASGKTDTLIKAKDINSDLKRLPALSFIATDKFYFSDEAGLHFYRLDGAGKGIYKSWNRGEAGNEEIFEQSEKVAYTRDNNLFVWDNNKETQITKDGGNGIVYGASVHRNEFGIEKGLFWSPLGNKLAFYRMDESMVTEYPLVNIDSVPAVAEPIRYPMAGQTSHHVTLGILDLASGKVTYAQTGTPDDHYLTNISWTPDESAILIAELNRGQNEMNLNLYSAADGKKLRTLITEKDEQWVEPEHPAQFIPGTKSEFLWQSEKEGFNHLYRYNLDGKQLAHLNIGNEAVTDVVSLSADGKFVYVLATSNDGLDRIPMKISMSGKMQILASESGVHSILPNSASSYFIDRFSSWNVPGKISLLDKNGKLIRTISEATDPIAMQALPKPELVKLAAGDGTILNARLFKPRNMESGKKYPVVIYVYGGPHAQMVTNSWLGGGNLWMSWMASQGYAVFTLDNRGSSNRGLEFEQVIHRKLGDKEMEDQMQGVAWLKKQSWVNPSRIGVHGWSFGGFMTSTLLCKNPGVFKAGVAGGPVIDWSFYEVMYTERYMDTPQENPDGYKSTSLLNSASDLKDRLMLIHGTVDDVVVWQHSQRMVKACVDAGVLIDYMIYPGHPHNVRGKDRLHLYKTISRYLMENLKEETY
ncbi:MAG: DPP IV N-terminal domain-containing protein [Bacteroidetes bacterium]|nr:DPP IV N-terminal domain-containing protein [Bacteroidota bacterium]